MVCYGIVLVPPQPRKKLGWTSEHMKQLLSIVSTYLSPVFWHNLITELQNVFFFTYQIYILFLETLEFLLLQLWWTFVG